MHYACLLSVENRVQKGDMAIEGAWTNLSAVLQNGYYYYVNYFVETNERH
jgi:hypothetical protein